jgi:signal transduction histidine kinase
MHHLLERQFKKIFRETPSSSPEVEAFLKVVSDTYGNYDKDRAFLERSFDLSSKEFLELHQKVLKLLEELRIEKEGVEQKIIERTQELKQKVQELNQNNQLLTKKEEELTDANNRLLELDKVKTEFISVAAHQLRTPLSAIKWTLSLLIGEHSENLTIEQRSLLLKGYESNERTINLINKMLVVTRIESGKMEYDLAFIHIEDLIDAALLDFAGHVQVHHIQLVFKKPREPLPYIHADPEKIRAVIQNLVENALYYTKNGGTVTLSVIKKGDFIKVFVTDTGIGIPLRQQSSIFNKFFRADNAVKTKTDGSGLGLFVAKSIVDKHGGEIGFESTENAGTTFYFTLPIVLDTHETGGLSGSV